MYIHITITPLYFVQEKKTAEKDKRRYKRYKYKDEEEGFIWFFVTRLDEHTRLRVFVFHSQCGWNDTDDALLPLEKGG